MGLPDLYPAQVGSPYTTLAAPYTTGEATMTVVDATKLPDAPNIVCLAGSAAGVTPMTFSLPITGADCYALPMLIEQVQLFEAASGGVPLSAAEKVEPLLLALAADVGAVVLTIYLPEVA